MVKSTTLSSGRKCQVDDEDYHILSITKWADDSNGYAIRSAITPEGVKTTEKMHRIIMQAKPGEIVDHINGCPWDNRKENLRIVTDQENARNSKMYSTNKSGYKGVAVYKNGRWTAQITVDYRKIHLGVFDDAEEAAIAYNDAATQHFGEYARLNLLSDIARHAAKLP